MGKAPGLDSINNEMIICLFETKPEIILKLFNSILGRGKLVTKWKTSIITTIYKKGSKTDPSNYRGISLISCLAKLFSAVLNNRLINYLDHNSILSNQQLGFRSGNRTSDALVCIRNMIDYYCHKSSQHIFGCFVDFQKAFDSIPRYKLFEKLKKHKITGNFFNTLLDMYTDDSSCIKIGDKMTNTFVCNQGVKQGCILSPTLFNVYLSDLPKVLSQSKNDPITIIENKNIGCIIWADDVLLLSKTEAGLKGMLEDLEIYTNENGLKLNLNKTKCMVFNKTGRHIRKHFKFMGQKVETTREYKYLGFIITPSGEITSGLKDLKDRAMRGYQKLKGTLNHHFLDKPMISIKLFDSLIKPILLYGSDFWGCLKMPKTNPIEIVQNKFLKDLLGVQKQTTNIGVLLEVGKLPLIIHAKKASIKNWERIVSGKANDLLLSSHLSAKTFSLAWTESIKENLSNVGMYENYLEPLVPRNHGTHNRFYQRLIDIYYQNAFETIQCETSKLRTYRLVKGTQGMSSYITNISNIKDRVALSKLRLSNHKLHIETGRYQHLDKTLRFCPFCKDQVEDEIHFVISCPTFTTLREQLFLYCPNLDKGRMCFLRFPLSTSVFFCFFQFSGRA